MGRRTPVKSKQPDKPLRKTGKITVIASLSFMDIAILISALKSKSAPVADPTTARPAPTATSPTYKTNIVSFTYHKGDVTRWPWKLPSMTVTCTDMAGGATATVAGNTYGITGREAIHSTIRGYATVEDIFTPLPRTVLAALGIGQSQSRSRSASGCCS